MDKQGRLRWIVSATALILAAGAAVAADPPRIDPRADKILHVMSDAIVGTAQFAVHTDESSDEITDSGDLVELSSSVDLALRRPDTAHVVLGGDLRPMRYWIGGGQVAMMDVARWTYALAPVPADLDAAIDLVWDRYGIKVPLSDFISADPYATLTRNVQFGSYVGLHEIDGVKCHHLAFKQSDIDWQIWIEDGMLPLPRKMLIVYKNEAGAPRYTARFSNWDLSPGLSDTIFEFEPPEGAEQVEFAGRVVVGGE